MMKGGNQIPKLSSDLHVYTLTCVHPHTYKISNSKRLNVYFRNIIAIYFESFLCQVLDIHKSLRWTY